MPNDGTSSHEPLVRWTQN